MEPSGTIHKSWRHAKTEWRLSAAVHNSLLPSCTELSVVGPLVITPSPPLLWPPVRCPGCTSFQAGKQEK